MKPFKVIFESKIEDLEKILERGDIIYAKKYKKSKANFYRIDDITQTTMPEYPRLYYRLAGEWCSLADLSKVSLAQKGPVSAEDLEFLRSASDI